MKRRRALLLGASGLIGSRCVVHLERSDAYESVICIVRRKGQLTFGNTTKMKEHVVDFDSLESFDGNDPQFDQADVFIAIGSTMKKAGSQEAFRRIDFDIPANVAKIAAARGTKRIALVSSVDASAKAGTFYLRVKGELEDALADLMAKNEGVLHAFRPSFLLGERKEERFGERFGTAIFKVGQGLLFGGLRRYRPIDVDQVARAMVAAMVGSDPQKPRMTYEYDAIIKLAEA